MTPPSLNDPEIAPVSRVGSAALRTLTAAVDLLNEAGRTLGSDSRGAALQDAIAAVSGRVPTIEDSERGVADAVYLAGEIVHLCDLLASHNRRPSPAALGCAELAETGARLALEALTEDRGWTGVQTLSRRARQLVEIQELRHRLDVMVETLEHNGVEGTPEGRSLRGDLHRALDSCDPETHAV